MTAFFNTNSAPRLPLSRLRTLVALGGGSYANVPLPYLKANERGVDWHSVFQCEMINSESMCDSRSARNSISSANAVSKSIRSSSLKVGLDAAFALKPGRRSGSNIALRKRWDGSKILERVMRNLGGRRRNFAQPDGFMSPPSL